jgi:hypothetical protein
MTMPERIWIDTDGEYWADYPDSTPNGTEYVRADLFDEQCVAVEKLGAILDALDVQLQLLKADLAKEHA